MVLTFFWFTTVLMQLLESLIWKDYKCELISNIAKIVNIIQPFIFSLILLIPNYMKKNKKNLKWVFLALGIYAFFVYRISITDYGCIKTKDGIKLKWWGKYSGFTYLVASITSVYFLISNKKLALSQIFLIIASLIISNLFYIYNNGLNDFLNQFWTNEIWKRVGSIWCWIAAISPVYNYLIFSNLKA